MAILKCKMCGGDILLSEDKTTGTCDHCGSTMTFPQVSDEQKLNLYNRANHFRRQNEFDKAITAYERILDQDDTDAEAHWGAVLSRYGIEYVEDPVTHERIPTCHRVQISSILSDGDYLAALENAPDTASRDLYEQEAHRIAEIQKGILSISSQEKPYDVFICYKETDEAGRRTRDSTLAQEIYYQLTNEGYKVFFSRITLEDKLGQQYEPYIFAALNSAKVMLVVGTKPEYFSAVWVKNEWSRYLALMKNDRSRLLIPCYRDMDPYDLPEELSALQSQDMSKIGFVQDLIRGVKKVLDSKKPTEPKPAVPQVTAIGANIENLMKRVRLFLEDGDFSNAKEYLNKILDENAEYAPAYAAKVCADFGFRKEAQLAEATFLFAVHPDWKKVLRFATPQQKIVYEGYAQQVKACVEKQLRDFAYDCAMEMAVNPQADRKKLDQEMATYRASCETYGRGRADGSRRKNAAENEAQFRLAFTEKEPGKVSEQSYHTAAEMFRTIGDDDAFVRAEQCTVLAEQARQKGIYDQAVGKSTHDLSAIQWDRLAEQFLTISNFRDAQARAEACQEKAEAIRSDLYKEAQKAMQNANDDSAKWKIAQEKLSMFDLNGYRDVDNLRKIAKQSYQECVTAEEEARQQAKLLAERKEAAAKEKLKRYTFFATFAAILTIAVLFVVTKIMIPKGHYDKGVSFRNAGRWEEAVAEFNQAGEFNDATTQVLATRYAEGEAELAAQDWDGAVLAFEQAGTYNDAATRILATRYAEGEAKRAVKDWDGAVTAFEQAGKYSNAATQILATRYAEGKAKQDAQDWGGAVAAFKQAGSYSDAAMQILAAWYAEGEAKRNAQDWGGAVAAFKQAGSYSDAATQILATRYAEGEAKRNSQDWDSAVLAFEQAGIYSDATTQIKETRYQQATSMNKAGKYAEAYEVYMTIAGYKDVDIIVKTDDNIAATAREAKIAAYKKTDNYVTFGTYPQTADGNDSTAIEWLVMDYDATNNRALLISRYGLAAQPYNEKYENITWEKCTLRAWLNNDFYNKAFSANEQSAILLTNVDNSKQGYSGMNASGGNNTQDRIFLLSYEEANKYFGVLRSDSSNIKSRVQPTAYAIKQGAYTSSSNTIMDGGAAGWWWLRSPGINQSNAANVSGGGSLLSNRVSNTSGAVRPAFWLNLESDFFQ